MNATNSISTSAKVAFNLPLLFLILTVVLISLATLTPNSQSTVNKLRAIKLNPLRGGAAFQCLVAPCEVSLRRFKGVMKDTFGNVALFLPFGFALASFKSKKRALWRVIAVAFGAGLLFSLTIEGAQFLLVTRMTDLRDVMFNAGGSLLGAALLPAASTLYRRFSRIRARTIRLQSADARL